MKISKIGIVFSSLYLISTIIIVIYAKTICVGVDCRLVMFLPAMPLAFFDDSVFVYIIQLVSHSMILYIFGYFISLIIKKNV